MKRNAWAVASVLNWKLSLVVLLLLASMQSGFAQADLAIQGAAVSPTAVAVGNSINATCTIYNLGNASAPSSNIGYYLSTNNALDATDTFIGSSTGGALSASGLSGAATYRSASVTIPPGTATGSYYILFVADYLNVITETNENNNVSSVSISVVPQSVDFTITGANLTSSSVVPGQTVYAETTIANIGNIASTSSNVGYYLSTNATLDASDVFIGSSNGGHIWAGSYLTLGGSVHIPASTAPGSYHLIFVTDFLNTVTESNENNNTVSRPLTVVAPAVDLVLQSAYLYNTSVTHGGTIGTEVMIYNQGNTSSPSSNVGYYLSTNNTFDAADVFIGSTSGGALAAGNSSYRSQNLTIPGNTTPGNYFIIFVADYLNTVTESNENNNTTAVALTVVTPTIDLVLQSPYLYTNSATPGSALGTEVRIHNLGNSSSPSSNIGYYLSTNTTLDAADVFIGSSTGGALAGGNYNYRSQNLTIPGNTTPGNYYVLFVADYLNTVTETNETNNTVSVALAVVTPAVDLVLDSPFLNPSTVSAGNPVNAGVTIYNQGNINATSSNIGFYLSTNNTLDAADELIGFSNGNLLYAGSYSSRSVSLTVPATTRPGTYYVIMVADYLNSVVEGNETNNTASAVLNVTEQGTTFLMPFSGNVNFTTCTGTLYDNGGTGNYSDGANGTATIRPAEAGSKVRLTFTSFATESCCDYLSIYDGTSTSAPLIGTYYGSMNPGTVYATNSEGALTLRFGSDGSVVYTGFEATIACVTSVPMPDLVLQNPYTLQSAVTAGSQLTVGSQLLNQGEVRAAASQVGYYLSTNNTYEASDVFLGYVSAQSMNNGAVANLTATLNIPIATAAGSYYVLMMADYSNLVNESNETNNLASVALTVQAPTIDLLMLSAFTSSSTLTPGSSFTVSSFIANQGASTSPSSNIGYYLSVNNTFESTDLFLGSTNGGSLTSGNSAYRTANLTLPASVTAGSYYIFYVADHTNVVSETNETNNVRSVAVTVAGSNFVDLMVLTKQLASTTVVAGTSVTATAQVKNNGNVAAPRSAVGFFLSSNMTLEQSDILLTSSQTAGTLAANATETVTATLTIPANTEPGSYYILFKSDYENHIAESNDENDLTYLAITVTGASVDLLISAAAVNPATVPAGQPVTASATIQNQGSVAAAVSSVGYYLSTNNTLDASDVLLSFSAGSTLAAGASANKGAVLTIPATTAAGSYFLLAVADHGNAQEETNETNNVRATALTVVAPTIDLAVQAPVASAASVVAGTGITLTANVVNTGTIASAATTLTYYLSQNNTLESTDVVLGSTNVSSIAANGTQSKVASYTIPASTAAGNYFILFQVDPDNTNAESNENNNLASVALAVTLAAAEVDLTVQNPTVSATSVVSGGTVNVTTTIRNAGTSPAASSTVGYYLSTDNVYNSADVALGASAGGALAAGASEAKSATLTIPTGTAAGNYFVLYVADHANAVSETNENNNVASVALTVTTPPRADLVAQSATASRTTVVAGDTLSITTAVINAGQAQAAASGVGFYISTRNVLDNTAIKIGVRQVNVLNAGVVASMVANLTIPEGLAAGAYHILVKADDADAVTESDETNNLRSIAITLAAPAVDLTVQPAAFVASVTAGNSYSFTTEIRNNGNALSASSNVGLYLSANNMLETTDILLSAISGGPLAAGSAANRSTSITIPAGTNPGAYYILVVADHTAAVTESDETNNMGPVAVTVVAPLLPDLRIHSPSVSASTVTAGNLVTVSGTVTNGGSADAPAGKVNYYLSANSSYEATDVLLGESNLALLAPGASTPASASLRIPAGTADGRYYVVLVADAANLIAEANETNNSSAIALTVGTPPAMPDLSVYSNSLNLSTVTAGSSVVVTGKVSNMGNASAPAGAASYYLSRDAFYDNADVSLGVVAVPALAPGNIFEMNANLLIPANTTVGSYYVLVMANAAASMTESDMTNNMQALPLTVSFTNSVKEDVAPSNFTVWPNPATDVLHIEASETAAGEKLAEITLYNVIGEKVLYREVALTGTKLQTSLHLQDLKTGMYQVHIKIGNQVSVRKIVVQP